MTVEAKAEFARRLGCDGSWVTRAGQKGRLVLVGEGRLAKVDVEKSLERLKLTRGKRFDMSEHWAAKRGDTAAADQQTTADGGNGETLAADEISRRTRLAQMRKEEAEADKRHRELQELTGDLVRRESIERALAGAVAAILGQIENMPDRIAPQVHGIDDMERVRARVKDEMEGLCRRVSDELGRLADDERGQAA